MKSEFSTQEFIVLGLWKGLYLPSVYFIFYILYIHFIIILGLNAFSWDLEI